MRRSYKGLSLCLVAVVAVLASNGNAIAQGGTPDDRATAVTAALYHRAFLRGDALYLYAADIEEVVGRPLRASDRRVRSLERFLRRPSEACGARIPRPYVTVDSVSIGATEARVVLEVRVGEYTWWEEYRLVEDPLSLTKRHWIVSEVLLYNWYQELLVVSPEGCRWERSAPGGSEEPVGGGEESSPHAPVDDLYSLFFSAVLERGEGWWGYPAPAEYCLAVAPGRMVPSMEASHDPSRAVLEEVRRAHPGRTFHPVSRCSSGGYPVRGPSGKAAGLLWVAPFDASEALTFEGGWSVQRDMTTWECSFAERGERVELRECRLLGET